MKPGPSDNERAATLNRRLSAVLALDVVGYSGMMHSDESGTVAALRDFHQSVLRPSLDAFGGRLVKLTGDGALTEFHSVAAAVRCAVRIQTEARRVGTLVFRMGIHVADIIDDDADIYGGGVNIAARLEAEADPGGILVSRDVRNQIRDRLDLTLEDRGEIMLKNIPRPMRAFAILLDARAEAIAAALPSPRPRKRRAAAVVILALGAVGLGALAVMYARAELSREVAPALALQPSVAVLPFRTSGDADALVFAAGVADDILARLSRSPYLKVIGRASAAAAAEEVRSPREIGTLLGVRYLVTGSVDRVEGGIVLVAELSDANDGAQLWSARFERPGAAVFDIQDEIVLAVAGRLDDRIARAVAHEALSRGTPELNVYERFLKARSLLTTTYGKEPTLAARALLESTIADAPDWAPPYAWLGYSHYREVARRWSGSDKRRALDAGTTATLTAIQLDPELPFAYLTMANLLSRNGKAAEAIRWAQKAIELDPNDPEAHAALANVLAFANRAGEGIAPMRRALSLDPLHPPLYEMYLGRALLLSGDVAAAVSLFDDCLVRQPDSWPCRQYLAVAYDQLGRREEAVEEFSRLSASNYPFESIVDFEVRGDFAPGDQRDLLTESLKRLGLPEHAPSPDGGSAGTAPEPRGSAR